MRNGLFGLNVILFDDLIVFHFFFHSHRTQPATMRRHDDAIYLYAFYFILRSEKSKMIILCEKRKNKSYPHHQNSMQFNDNEYFTKCYIDYTNVMRN